ncbi:MAG: LuxR family transcriptional regulator, partial [Calditrichaeota bacterium]
DPQAAIRLQEQLIAGDLMRRRREFVERWLTPAEREVVQLACKGLDNLTIARRLHKSERTVSNQLSHVYEKLHDWRGSPDDSITDRNVLIASLSPYFTLTGMQGT